MKWLNPNEFLVNSSQIPIILPLFSIIQMNEKANNYNFDNINLRLWVAV